MKPTHPLIPPSNSKIVPPPIPAPRKESFEEENARLKAEVERLEKQVNNLITSLQKSHDEHGKALYKLKYKK